MKRALTIIGILVVIVGIGIAVSVFLTPKEYTISGDESIQTSIIKQETIIATVDTAARLQAKDSANLSFEVTGKVANIYVEEGSRVEVGTLLAELDSTDLEESVRLAEIDLARTQAQFDKLLENTNADDLAAAQASLSSAEDNLRSLQSPGQADLDSAQLTLASAKASLQRLLDGPNSDSVTVASAGLRRAEIARNQAQDAYNAVSYDSRSASYQGAALEQATIDYETALANYNLAIQDPDNAQILAAQAQVSQAEAALDRITNPSAGQIAAAEAQVSQAKATLERLQQGASDTDIAISQAAVDASQVNLDRAKRNLERTHLFSTISGTVTGINIKEGELPANPVAIVVSDLSAFKLEVEVDEIDINRIQLGQPVVVTLDSLPDQEFTGYVDQIAIAPIASSTGITAYPVKVLIDSANAPFKIGMNVNATIETERLEDAIVVPNRAVQIDRETGKTYVDKVIDDQRIERTEIVLGQRGTTVSEVQSGLDVGTTIAIIESSRRDQLMQAFGGQ